MALSGMFPNFSQMSNFSPDLYTLPKASTGYEDAIQHTKSPSTTGTSVLGLVYDKGVVLAADTLGSYGSLARFRDCPRLLEVNNGIVVGASGDYADFQYLKDAITQKVIDEQCLNDGFEMEASDLHSWLTRVLYNRRSKFDPFWTTFLVAGVKKGEKPFLGFVDKIGTAFEDRHIATGFGMHIALPLLRSAVEANPNMNLETAKTVLVKCLEVLCYRDARASARYQLAVVTEKGTTIDPPINVKLDWKVATHNVD